ncbi:MAG: hypothetical protein ACFFDI_20755 [Promethearchaeota archaeon]
MMKSVNYLLSRVILDAGHEGEHMMDNWSMGGMWGMFPFSPMMLLMVLAGLLLLFIPAYLIYKDASRRQNPNAGLWALLVFILPLFGLLIYLLVINTQQSQAETIDTPMMQDRLPQYCTSCGAQVNVNDLFCSSCSARLPTS